MRTLYALWGTLAAMTAIQAGPGVTVTPQEMAEARQWTAAKFEGRAAARPTEPGLTVLANNDPVQKNARNGRPMNLAGKRYTRGLYCHAVSRVLVRLPGPGKTLTATVGVDSNEQTSGGRGSVIFGVQVGGQEEYTSGLLREGMPEKPVSVDLGGATEFVLTVSDGDDGISCDQADWADAKATLADGREVWLADLPLVEGPPRAPYTLEPFFSFVYDGKPSSELLRTWQFERASRKLDAGRTERTLTWTDPGTGLVVRCVGVEYADYPTVEWTLHFRNGGKADTPLLQDIRAVDTRFEHGPGGEFVLHHQVGTNVAANDYQPLRTTLEPKADLALTPTHGRPCAGVLPYFNVEWQNEGVLLAVGWPGKWAARFLRDDANGLRLVAGQETTRLRLHPGEEVRTPLIALQFYRGDRLRAQNVWRRWMLAHNLPRPDGTLPGPLLTPCSSHQFGEMIHANEENQKQFIDRYLEEKLGPDYWWMDAGWYVNKTGWPNTGTWEVDPQRFPRGLRAITNHAHAKGLKSIVWFEPERVTPGTRLYEQHPEWLLGKDGEQKLLDLGNPAAREWLTGHVSRLLTEQGIDLYRQDYNVDPLPYWRGADAEDRQGVTENHYCAGYLAYWDALRRRFPQMLIDTCASGGHRNDLETLRRAVPFLRSDCIMDPVGNQGHTYGLSLWMPYHGTGSSQTDPYALRSAMTGSNFIACWDMRDRALDYDRLRKLTADWRRAAPAFQGDFWPLTPWNLDDGAWIAWQYDQPEAGKGVVQAFRRAGSVYESARFPLRGLDPAARYAVTDADTGFGTEAAGRDLMEVGLLVTIPARPGAVILFYRRIK